MNGDWRDDIGVDLHYMARARLNTMCGFRPCIASQVFGGGGGLVDLPNKLILLVLGLLEIRWYLVSGQILDQMSRGIRGFIQVTAVLGSICTHMAS